MRKEQIYIGTKIIKAVEMDHATFMDKIKHSELMEDNEMGYKVTYPGGYVSWSPRKAFDDSHRLVTGKEYELLAL